MDPFKCSRRDACHVSQSSNDEHVAVTDATIVPDTFRLDSTSEFSARSNWLATLVHVRQNEFSAACWIWQSVRLQKAVISRVVFLGPLRGPSQTLDATSHSQLREPRNGRNRRNDRANALPNERTYGRTSGNEKVLALKWSLVFI